MYFSQLLCLRNEKSPLEVSLQTDCIGWTLNAVKHDRINTMLVDFSTRICLNIPLCGRGFLFSLMFIVNQLKLL